ncbi:MAG: S8 family serine peptidase [Terracidiphilus sp.]
MQIRKMLFALILVLITIASVAAQTPKSGSSTNQAAGMHPAALRGPLAVTANVVAEPGYGLFSCQVGLSVAQCYDPFQMRTAYGIDAFIKAGFDGSGKTIVILDAYQDPNIYSQFAYFNSFYGLPSTTLTQVSPDGLGAYDSGWAEEISLDVQWAHAIAPGANIVLELAKDSSDTALISALNDAIDNHRGDVISMSFGAADSCLGPELTEAWHKAFVKATEKGITLFASTGDEGAAQSSCDGSSWIQATSSPASDPLVVGVSGTELHAAGYCLTSLGCDPTKNPAAGTYVGEIGWNEGPPYGDYQPYFSSTGAGGGGYSTVWSKPLYQALSIRRGNQRGVGDVSYNASVMHGVLVYLDLPGMSDSDIGFYLFGGTSAGSPQWAAITAIADQVAHHDLGFISNSLYELGQFSGNPFSAFHDITSGNNSAGEYDASNNLILIPGYSAGPGWDPDTGIGTPKAGNLLTELPLFWSPFDAQQAIATSKPEGDSSHPGKKRPH